MTALSRKAKDGGDDGATSQGKEGHGGPKGLPAPDEVKPLKGKPQGCRRDETSPTGVQARREEGVRATDEPWTCCKIEWFCFRKRAKALNPQGPKVPVHAARMATSANPIARKGLGKASELRTKPRDGTCGG